MTVNLPIILAFAGIITHLLLELWNQPAWYYFGDLPECAFLHFAGNCVKRQSKTLRHNYHGPSKSKNVRVERREK